MSSTSGVAKSGACTGEGLLHVLRNSTNPSQVDAVLLQLLHSLSTPTECVVCLSPASLCCLLRLLVERTEDAWLEVRKKIAFVFSDLVSKGHGDVLADALLYGTLQTTTCGEAHVSLIDFGDASPDDGAPTAVLSEARELIGRLASAHGTVERCVPAADVFRTFTRVPALLEIIMLPTPLENNGANSKAPFQQQQQQQEQERPKQHHFHESCVGILCRSVASDTTVLCTETWRSLTTTLYTNKGLSASLLLHFFTEFVVMLVGCLQGANFVAKLHALEFLAALLEDSAFLKARRKFAESPALLCALIPLTNSPSAHIRFLTFDTLKVFIAKGNKPAPIRYILYINREMLARYVEDYSTGELTIDKRLEIEKQKLLQSLISLEPLSHEEEVFLSVA
ncbi:hypothetical protein DQ04_00971030 [Trypanosoma grayi]|uniref:hypothetical protein n=1 Tax=Trypanosoma grayi TaxID=71804 RepID=UPI0004F4436B|nr:hypothetical protein DQ04_00971030 [Trypanosoma grayi]KEG13493.1 hypothetical protein DQ04_00971030 [Trypanosoma grayi]